MPRYELVEGTSSKFWEIALDGAKFTTTWGKIGTAGQSTTKEWKDAATAQKEHDKLVAEKVKKGYQLVGGGAGGAAPAAHAKAGTAFRMADLEQLDGPVWGDGEDDEKGPTFMGLRIVTWDPEEGLKDPARKAWKIVDQDFGSVDDYLGIFERFLADPNAGKVKALVIGNWGEGLATSGSSGTPDANKLRDAICAAAPRLPGLAALFIHDVTAEECEVSWQNFTDVAPILAAYPDLQHLRVRGDTGGGARLQHARLRSLQLEGSNQSAAVVRQVAEADLPALEHLELWFGPEEYNGGDKDMADLMPILSGKLFPALKYLGIRDSDQADEVARTVAQAPLLERLDVLDLSLGNLGDAGAEALIASPAVARLKKLDVRHHYLSDPVLKRLKALSPVKVVESRSEQMDEAGELGEGERRYVAVAE